MGRIIGSVGKYAVLDFETTGLSVSTNHDRVIEIGLVVLDKDLTELERFSSLVKVKRDLGAISIHGIRPSDLESAPTFHDLAPELIQLINGKVIVCHNASFDLQFLRSELQRLAISDTNIELASICTKEASRRLGVFPDSRLETICEILAIENPASHEAISDAIATAELLRFLAEQTPDILNVESVTWIDVPLSQPAESVAMTRAQVRSKRPLSFVQELVSKLLPFQGTGDENDYAHSLEAFLIDSELSSIEVQQLLKIASESELSVSQVDSIHNRYFESLVSTAWADGVITNLEEADIRHIGRILGIGDFAIERALAAAPQIKSDPVLRFVLNAGDLVALTGSMDPPKVTVSAMLKEMGLVVADSVTKKTKLVVAADPDSLSGKAEKARAYGIRICAAEWVVEWYENKKSQG